MTMCFDFLLLGHLLGDFTFQTNRIAENKNKHYTWNLLHTAIVTQCMLVLSIPFENFISLLVILNGGLHFIIDYFKSKLPQKTPAYDLLYFILDQCLHISIIYIISIFSKESFFKFTVAKIFVKFFTLIVFISSFASILIKYILRLLYPYCRKTFFIGNERVIGVITRLTVFFSMYIHQLTFLHILFIMIITYRVAYFYKFWRTLMTPSYFYTGLFLDFLIPISAYYLFL